MIYMIKCAIFDLDGTLVNTIDDLGNATDYVLEKYGKDKNGRYPITECSSETVPKAYRKSI